ncbi:MAG: TolC family protein [wastewater metagenome]|nr:TolC family protein [Candidatus Loosdrechtia aerotolerans]
MIEKIVKKRSLLYRGTLFVSLLLSFILNYQKVSFGSEDKSTMQIPSPISPENTIEITSNMEFLSLGVRESILFALRNNLDIEISRLNLIASDYDITVEKAIYDPILLLTGSIQNSEVPINSELVGGFVGGIVFDPFIERGRTADAVIQSLIPTGATIALEYNIFRDFVDPNRFRFLNPSFTNFIEARITQPLLRGAGLFYNRSLIFIAQNNKKISLAQFKTTVMDVSNFVQEAYWNFIGALEDLKVAKKSLERAEDLLRKNKIQVEAGTLAPIEIIDAEAGVASRVEAVISAKNFIKDSEDELKRIMNLENNEIISDATIIPVDAPVFEPKAVEMKDAIKTAMRRRSELEEFQLRVENAGIQTRRRRNELYPQLDFTGGIRYTGLGGTASEANDSTFSEDFQGEFFELTLSFPLGNRSARALYKRSKLERRQAQMDVQRQELDIVVEVRNSVRAVMTNIERVRATRKARELAEERLAAEEKKFEVGRTTSLEVLRAQEDLATAEGNEIRAIVDYKISVGNLERAKGTILDAYDIKIDAESA